MKAFSFRLEPILHLREGARKSALTIYAKSIRESQKLENELFTLEQSLEDITWESAMWDLTKYLGGHGLLALQSMPKSSIKLLFHMFQSRSL